jgi:hypothetical protein
MLCSATADLSEWAKWMCRWCFLILVSTEWLFHWYQDQGTPPVDKGGHWDWAASKQHEQGGWPTSGPVMENPPISSIASRPPLTIHLPPQFPPSPCKGPIYILCNTHTIHLSLLWWSSPHLPLAYFLICHPFPIGQPKFTWTVNCYITCYTFARDLFITMMMEAVCTSETWVNFNMTTRCYIPEDCKLHSNLINKSECVSVCLYVCMYVCGYVQD